ncbi:MAG TPA: hypothetical protein VK901_12735, partial [Nitrospiraceae bacterium]|nr:hypothetical protein [Nitrospiraceae bacterium]
MISQRTVLSLCQYLDLQGATDIRILFEKHGLQFQPGDGAHIQRIHLSLSRGTAQQFESVLEEIVRTEGYFADKVCGWPFEQVAAYKQRWQDLVFCLELDGYRVFDQKLI